MICFLDINVINAKRIYIFEWDGFGIGNDLFSVISQKINGNFFVKEEGGGQVFDNSNLCCGRSNIIFRNRIMLVRIKESLGEEVIGEGRDAIIGDVLEISTLPLVREMWQLLEKRRVFILYSVQLENLMEVHSVMDDGNCSRRDVNLCRGYMLDMVAYYANFYRKLGDVFGQMICSRVDESNELVDASVLNWLRASDEDELDVQLTDGEALVVD